MGPDNGSHNNIIYVFHFNLTAILCISILTVTFIKLLLNYLLAFDITKKSAFRKYNHVVLKATGTAALQIAWLGLLYETVHWCVVPNILAIYWLSCRSVVQFISL